MPQKMLNFIWRDDFSYPFREKDVKYMSGISGHRA